MTKRDFFIIAIKLFGIYLFFVSLFTGVPQSVQILTLYQNGFNLIPILLIILVVIALFLVLIFFADRIVDVLKLDEKFDDPNIQVTNFDSATIIKLGCFIIGGFLLIDNIPFFLFQSYRAFQNELNPVYQDNAGEKYSWIISILNTLLGWLLVTNFNVVAKWFGAKENDNQKHL